MSPGSVGLALLTSVALTVPLAWRRTAPLAVALVVGSALALDDLLAGWDAAVLSFDCAIIASYSAGAHARQARSVAALVALMAANVVDALVSPGSRAGNLALAIVVFSLAPWLVGQALRRERRRTDQLRQLSASLAAEREELARMAVADERVRLARELHDVVAHAISVIAIQADAADKVLSADASRARKPLSVIQTTPASTLAEMRRLVGMLRATDELAPRAPQPGAGDVATLVEQARRSGSAVTLEVLGDVRPLPGPLDLTVYRIVQEGLTNVRKHAGRAGRWSGFCYGQSSRWRCSTTAPAVASRRLPRRTGVVMV